MVDESKNMNDSVGERCRQHKVRNDWTLLYKNFLEILKTIELNSI